MKIKSVALIGAGALGSYFICRLTDLLGDQFCLIADGERKARLEANGVIINDVCYKPPVRTAREAGHPDLVLVATKYQALEGVLDDIEALVGENTIVMSLLNGINSEEVIAKRIGEGPILYSLMRIASARKGNEIRFDMSKTPGLFLGEKGSAEITPRIRAVCELMDEAGLRYHVMEDILQDQWKKYALNITYNLPQAVLGVGYGSYFLSEHMAFLRDKMMEEVEAVAGALGITIPPLENYADTWPTAARFSTLQDLDAGRTTEIDMFTGVLLELAEQYNIPVPYCTYTHHAIKALEQKNLGMF